MTGRTHTQSISYEKRSVEGKLPNVAKNCQKLVEKAV